MQVLLLAATLLFGVDQYVRMHGFYDHGYTDRKIGPDEWEVRYEGNPNFERRTVEFSALFRAAEVALANGFAWFEVTRDDADESLGSRTTYNPWSGFTTRDRSYSISTLLIRGLKGGPPSSDRVYNSWETIQKYAPLVRLPSGYKLPTPPPVVTPLAVRAAPQSVSGGEVGAPRSTAPPSASAGEIKPGFRDLRWGSPVTIGMVLIEERQGGERVYTRASDRLTIGEVPLLTIRYHYFDGFLRGVEIGVAEGDTAALVAALTEVWGAPQMTRTGGSSPTPRWSSPTLGADDSVATLVRKDDRPATLRIVHGKFYEARQQKQRVSSDL